MKRVLVDNNNKKRVKIKRKILGDNNVQYKALKHASGKSISEIHL